MANCIYCGQSAGWFKKLHPACEDQHQDGERRMLNTIRGAQEDSLESLLPALTEISNSSYIPDNETKSIIRKGLDAVVTNKLEDGILTEEEETFISKLSAALKTDPSELSTYQQIGKASVIRCVLAGDPRSIVISGNLGVNLIKNEQVVWVFGSVEYLEDRIKRQYVGASQGLSMRVMKGIYYRVGAFKGETIERTDRVSVDTGLLVVTTKNIYFVGQKKSLRLPYGKIVSFQPFSNGLGVIRDLQTAKPQIFITNDGQFTYNLVTNLAQQAA